MDLDSEFIDLSMTLEDGMITYPTRSHHGFEACTLGRIAIEGRETRKLTLGSHCGTHIDAPKHFFNGAPGIDETSLDTLVGPALLIDVGELCQGAEIGKAEIEQKMAPHEKVERLVIRTGWSRFWNTEDYYSGWPVLSWDAADFLIEKNIKLLGFDFPSPDPGYSGPDRSLDCPLHKLFFNQGITLVEYLTNLDKLEEGMILLMALPLKLKGFDGSPARVAACQIRQ